MLDTLISIVHLTFKTTFWDKWLLKEAEQVDIRAKIWALEVWLIFCNYCLGLVDCSLNNHVISMEPIIPVMIIC